MSLLRAFLLATLVLALGAAPCPQEARSTAQIPAESGSAPARIVVGIFDAPPFSEPLDEAVRDGLPVEAPAKASDPAAGGESSRASDWTGTSMRLFERVARRLGVEVEYRTGTEREILDALARGEIDACASPLAPTPGRLGRFEFSHTYAAVGITAATRTRDSLLDELEGIADGLFSRSQMRIYVAILALALLFALLMWVAERRRNQDFHGHPIDGFGSSLWWSVVTLATVGYGDKVPRTGRGRTIAGVWMLVSLVLTSVFTATIVSAITLGSLDASPVRSQADLSRLRLVAVESSISSDWLESRGLPHRRVRDFAEGIRLVEQRAADALVGPEIELRTALRSHPALTVAPARLTDEFMCFGLARSLSDDFRERFDAALVMELPRSASAEPDTPTEAAPIRGTTSLRATSTETGAAR